MLVNIVILDTRTETGCGGERYRSTRFSPTTPSSSRRRLNTDRLGHPPRAAVIKKTAASRARLRNESRVLFSNIKVNEYKGNKLRDSGTLVLDYSADLGGNAAVRASVDQVRGLGNVIYFELCGEQRQGHTPNL